MRQVEKEKKLLLQQSTTAHTLSTLVSKRMQSQDTKQIRAQKYCQLDFPRLTVRVFKVWILERIRAKLTAVMKQSVLLKAMDHQSCTLIHRKTENQTGRIVRIWVSCLILLQHFPILKLTFFNPNKQWITITDAWYASAECVKKVCITKVALCTGSIHSLCSVCVEVNTFPCRSKPPSTRALSSNFNKRIPINKMQWLVFKLYITLCSKHNSSLWTYKFFAPHRSNTVSSIAHLFTRLTVHNRFIPVSRPQWSEVTDGAFSTC